MNNIDRILAYLLEHHPAALKLVTEGTLNSDVSAQDANDIIYTLWLIGRTELLTAKGVSAFAAHVGRWQLAAGVNSPIHNGRSASVHLTAYILGTTALLRAAGHDVASEIITGKQWRLHELFDDKLRPRWPTKWSHHSWRVSHWIGGAPSILLSLRRLVPERCRAQGAPVVDDVLSATDALVDDETGLLRTYHSRFLQSLFRAAYRIRHDPAAGDVGGVVHLHWINYATGRMPYKAGDALFARAAALLTRTPFIERTPYCLDFDIIQIVRTASPSPAALTGGLQARARRFGADIASFFETGLTRDYRLHRLPGALAAQHECALITGDRTVQGLGIAPLDTIRAAGWI
jgi:hypothetical protein